MRLNVFNAKAWFNFVETVLGRVMQIAWKKIEFPFSKKNRYLNVQATAYFFLQLIFNNTLFAKFNKVDSTYNNIPENQRTLVILIKDRYQDQF